MCFPSTVALEGLLCSHLTRKTDFSKERIIYLEHSNQTQTSPAVAFISIVYKPEYLYECQLSCGSIICHRKLGCIMKIPQFLLPDNLKMTFTAIIQPCMITGTALSSFRTSVDLILWGWWCCLCRWGVKDEVLWNHWRNSKAWRVIRRALLSDGITLETKNMTIEKNTGNVFRRR